MENQREKDTSEERAQPTKHGFPSNEIPCHLRAFEPHLCVILQHLLHAQCDANLRCDTQQHVPCFKK
jgi:hypothetical protein